MDKYICSRCEQTCEIYRLEDVQHLEFWGIPVTLTQVDLVSECCNQEAYTPRDWRDNGWPDPNWPIEELVEHGFVEPEDLPEEGGETAYRDGRIAELEAQLAVTKAALKTIAAVAGGKGHKHTLFEWVAQCAAKALTDAGGEK